MPTFVAAETYSDGQVLFEHDLDTLVQSIEDFFNITRLDSANVQDSVLANLIPVGTVVMYGGTTPPTGWLTCDGSVASKALFPTLYGLLQETFGPSTSTTFTLPDFSRRIPIGMGGTQVSGPGIDLGDTGGSETHTLSISETPSHTHTSGGSHTHTQRGALTSPGQTDRARYRTNATSSFLSTGLSTAAAISTLDSRGGGGAHNNVQPSLVVNFIIKY